MTRKAVFLDRDGTINVDHGYVCQIEKFEFIDGVIEGLQRLQELGFLLIIVTNQSGIARGYYTEEQFNRLTEQVNAILKSRGVYITDVFHCPHLGEECDCRKPKTALFYQAQEKYQIDFSRSYAIGDKMRDLQICMEQDVYGYLLDLEKKSEDITRYATAGSLLEAVEQIEKRVNRS